MIINNIIMMTKPQVIVFGSLNMDMVVNVADLPRPGETLLGHSFATTCGGKGANQAVALARLGIETALVGRVGDDNFGQILRQSLQNHAVETKHIEVDTSTSTGIAMIAVDGAGENQIIVVPGANGQVGKQDLLCLQEILPACSYLLLQLEIPLIAVRKAVEIAQKLNIPVILDPAPARELPPDIYLCISIITPNATEASQLVGFSVETYDDAARAALSLQQKGVETVIITLGAQGVFCATAQKTFVVSALPVEAVDTVAAGDAFNAGLTAALVEGNSLADAVIWGAVAGALCVTQAGAQTSLPTRTVFDVMLNQFKKRELLTYKS